MHRRKKIRDAIVTLVTGLATTGVNVSTGRVYPLDTSRLPWLDVTTTQDDLDTVMISGAPYSVSRLLTVEITAREGGDVYIDTLDQIALEVEQALGTDVKLGGLISDMNLVSSSLTREAEIETPVGELVMEYSCRYDVGSIDPQ